MIQLPIIPRIRGSFIRRQRSTFCLRRSQNLHAKYTTNSFLRWNKSNRKINRDIAIYSHII